MSEPGTTILSSFNGGEASPRMGGRIDQRRWFTASRQMLGFLPLAQGPAQAAPGTVFIAKAKGPARLIEFEPYVTQGYVLELSDHAMRFYTNNLQLMDGDVPLEISTPWSIEQVRQLDFHGSIDVCYFTGGGVRPQVLKRTGGESFTLEALSLDAGPFGPGNTDELAAIGVAGTTSAGGTVTLTCTRPVFAATDVGRLIEIEAFDYSSTRMWEPHVKVSSADKRTWDTRVYRNNSAGLRFTGSNPPIHDRGVAWDGSLGVDVNDKGPYGAEWAFLYGRFGLLRITAFTSDTEVEALVLDSLPESLTTTPSWRWGFGAFSDTSGWPDAVSIADESLVLFHSLTATGYVSVQGALTNYRRRDSSGDFQHDLAGAFTLPNRDSVRWMAADRGVILLGASRGEYAVRKLQTNTQSAGPPQFEVTLQQTNGSALIKPIQADGRMLFVQRAGRKLLELGYAFQSDRYTAPDLTRFADHIGVMGFVDLAWQQEPERHAWAVRGDGSLAALVYVPEEEVLGWVPRTLGEGLSATSICRITDPDGRRDQLWLSADIGEETWVLLMAKLWETGDAPAGQFYVDAGITRSGESANTLQGLDHLNGRTVEVLVDGIPHPSRVVSGGSISLDHAGETRTAGLPFPARIVPMRIEAGQAEGTAQGKIARIPYLTLRVAESQGMRVTVCDPESEDFNEDDWLDVETRRPEDPMDAPVPLYTGDLHLDMVGMFDRGGIIAIERIRPTNITLLAIIPAVEVGEA